MPSSTPLPDQRSPSRARLPLWREFFRYAAVGGLALAADWWVLHLGIRLGLRYPAATAAGFAVGLVLNYALCVIWAWRGTSATTPRDFMVFSLIGVGGLLLTEALMYLAVGRVGLQPELAKAPVAAAVFAWNFGLRRFLVFFR